MYLYFVKAKENRRKYYHTYRVVDYAEQIGKAEDLNEYDLNLTFELNEPSDKSIR